MMNQTEQYLTDLTNLAKNAPNELHVIQSEILEIIEKTKKKIETLSNIKLANPGHRLTKDEILSIVQLSIKDPNNNIEIVEDELEYDIFNTFQTNNEDIKTTDLNTFTCILNGSHNYVEAISFTCNKDNFIATTYIKNMSYFSQIKTNSEIMDFLQSELQTV